MAPDLTPDEVDASNARIHEFVRKMKSVPESDRTVLMSEKFAGPVGRPIADPDEPTGDPEPDAGQ